MNHKFDGHFDFLIYLIWCMIIFFLLPSNLHFFNLKQQRKEYYLNVLLYFHVLRSSKATLLDYSRRMITELFFFFGLLSIPSFYLGNNHWFNFFKTFYLFLWCQICDDCLSEGYKLLKKRFLGTVFNQHIALMLLISGNFTWTSSGDR